MHHTDATDDPANATVEAWLITLVVNELITAAWKTDTDGWLIRRRPGDEPEPLPNGDRALAFIAELQEVAHAFTAEDAAA